MANPTRPAPPACHPHSGPAGSRYAQRGGLLPQRILIVDDDEALRESLALVLGAEGYETSLARDGADALARIEDAMPDIVFVHDSGGHVGS